VRPLRPRLDASAFAFVMATGIVSVAARLQGLATFSEVAFTVAVLGWSVLAAVLCVQRLRSEPRRPRLESFAFVAATAVLGARFSYAGSNVVALALWALAIAAWFVLLVRRPELTPANGSWFLVVVGTEALAVLGSLIARRLDGDLLPAALTWWALGLALYPFVAAAIAVGLRSRPRFGPDLWITMGALAIATLAGTELLDAARALHALGAFRLVLRDVAIATWVFASTWILPLAVAEARNPAGWRYCSGRWSFVFPLGMYAVATQMLGKAAHLGPLSELAHAFFAIAVLAWALALGGLGRRAILEARLSRSCSSASRSVS
jgi:tellurite resistance protein TehA-like permease